MPHPSHTAAALTAAALLTAGLAAAPPSTAAADTDAPAPASASASAVRIHDIQGTTRTSPYAGRTVADVPGVVTAVRAFGSSRGFWFQDPHPDADAATSEGIFVFTGSKTPAVAVGDAVRVSATVTEYYPGGAAAGGQSLTELSKAAWTVDSAGNPLPAAVTLNTASLPARYAPAGDPAAGGSVEGLALRPRSYALDRYESLEGMRVRISDSRVVGPSNSYGELWVTVRPGQNATPRGGTLYGSYTAQNGGRLKVMSLIPYAQRPFPQADTGDELTGDTVGPLDYDNFGGYTLQAAELGALKDNHLAADAAGPAADDELSVATFNVENLSPKDTAAKFDRLAAAVVHNLAAPDIVSLEEVQDDDGPTDDGVVTAGATMARLTDAIAAAGGPAYRWRSIDPVDDEDGGQPGGNIRQVFLYNPERVSFTDRAGGSATGGITVTGRGASTALSASPGRIAPGDAAWQDSRKPLAGEFTFRGRTVFVIANHFDSKGGDQGLDSRFQPPARSSETQRVAQAGLVNGFVKELRKADPKARAVVLGDLNDYTFSPALDALTAGGALDDLITRLPAEQRYTYVYNGNSQVLDHILTTPGIGRTVYRSVHINAEFANQMSDHDPQLVRIRF